jgi:trehalose 6-phosphate synthase
MFGGAEETREPLLALAGATDVGIVLDLDGTLIPFARTIEEATVDDELLALLAELAALPGVLVLIATGRPQAAVEAHRAQLPVLLWAAEHGAVRHDGTGWTPLVESAGQLNELTTALQPVIDAVPGARLESKRTSLCVHWRAVADEDQRKMIDDVELAIDEWLESHEQFERLVAASALEVRRRGVHKGTAIAWLRARLPADAPLLAMGDDITDEDMFAALAPRDLGILVSSVQRPTRATFRIGERGEARRLLRWFIAARRGEVPLTAAGLPEMVSVRAARPPAPGILVMSNRLPPLPEATLGRKREVGGLVAALEPALISRGGLWLGWSGRESDGELRVDVDHDNLPATARFDYKPAWRELFYSGFCNRSLWPLLHCFPGRVRYIDAEWQSYVEVNGAYAEAASGLVERDTPIWVHDYHLLLAARGLRERGHRGALGFFLHVPFPPLDIFETLPWAAEVLEAMLAFDLIGFHTRRWRDNFATAAIALTGARAEGSRLILSGHRAAAEIFPIGIDAGQFEPEAASPPAADVEQLRATIGDRKLVLGVDRLDYSKGIPERLEAFERMLQIYPEWRGKVSLIQVSVPSRADVPEYAQLRQVVENLVGRINGDFGEAHWVPVRYLYRSYDAATLAALFRIADVGYVTPLRDGMNLVAKEFVAAQRDEAPGVLLLSRFAGAADELDGALLTNPYHRDGMARDLDRALRMPGEERRERQLRNRRAVNRCSATAWSDGFVSRLELLGRRRAAARALIAVPRDLPRADEA